MKISITVVLLFSLLLTASLAAAIDVPAKLLRIPLNAPVAVTLKTKERLQGLKGQVGRDSFVLAPAAAGGDERTIAFSDVKSIRRLDQQSHVGRDIGIGIACAVGAVAAVFIYALAHL